MELTKNCYYNHFFYKGFAYSEGAIVELDESYASTHSTDLGAIWKYARFNRKIPDGSKTRYLFTIAEPLQAAREKGASYPFASIFSIPERDIHTAIKRIVRGTRTCQVPNNVMRKYLLDYYGGGNNNFPEISRAAFPITR